MSENPLLKALVRAHTRRTKSGKTVQVRSYNDKRIKQSRQTEQPPVPAILEALAAEDYRRLGVSSPAFKAWFGDWEANPDGASKVVTEKGEPQETYEVDGEEEQGPDGKPIVVYHGSQNRFRAFDKARLDDRALWGPGFYFTESREVAAGKRERVPIVTDELYETMEEADQVRRDTGNKALWRYAPQFDRKTGKWRAVIGEREEQTQSGYAQKGYDMPMDERARFIQALREDETAGMAWWGESGYVTQSEREQFERHIGHFLSGHFDFQTFCSFAGGQPFNLKPMIVAFRNGMLPEGHLYPVYLSIKRPFTVDKPVSQKDRKALAKGIERWCEANKDNKVESSSGADYGTWGDQPEWGQYEEWRQQLLHPQYEGMTGQDLLNLKFNIFPSHLLPDLLKAGGFDGITHIGHGAFGASSYDQHRVWIAFEPHQIKAVENVGTFDATTDDIYKGLGRLSIALQKARKVKAHTRRTPSGKLTQVQEHTDKRDARREALHEEAKRQIAEGMTQRARVPWGNQERMVPDEERGGISLKVKTSDLQTGRTVIRFRTESGRVRYMGPNEVLVSDINDAQFYKVHGRARDIANKFTRKYPNVGDYEILTVYLQYDAEALKKSRPVKGHTRKTPSGKLALIPPHMDKRDPARPEQSTQNAPLAASQPPTYNKRVADNLKHMGAPDGWRSLAIVGMDEGKDLKKKRAMVPQFEPIPEGYTTAPSLYLPSGGIGEQVSIGFGVGATCELCGKQGIKFRYPVVHDGKKWVMWVGSECVTTFGEASGKQQERDHQKDARKSIVLELRDMARQIVQAFADGDRFGRDRNTHPNPSACYDIWNKLNALGRSVTLFGIDTDKEGMAETDRQLQAWLRKNEGYIAALKAAFADLMAMREFRVPLSPDEQKIADKAAATYNEAIAIANAPDTGHGTRFRETIASILRMLGGMSAEDYGYRIVIGQRDKTVQSTHQTLTTHVKQWNAYNGVPVKKGLASLFKSRTVRAHQMHTAAGITVRREHTDKRPAAKQRLNARPIQVYRGMSSAEYWKWVDAGLIPKSKHGASSGMAGWAEEHSKFGKNDILVSFLAPKGTLRRGDADGHWITHEAIPLDRAMLQIVSGDLKPRSEIEASLSAIKNTRKRLYAAIKPGAILRGHGSGIWRDFIVYEKKGRRFVIGPYVPDGYQVADLTSRHRPSDPLAAELWEARRELDAAVQHRDAAAFWKDRINEAGWGDKGPAPTDEDLKRLADRVEAAQIAWAQREEEIRQEQRAKRFEVTLSNIIAQFQTGITIAYPDDTYQQFSFDDMMPLQARTLRKSRQIKAHIMRTASGELTMRRQHTDKRDAAKPRFTEKRVTPKGNVQYVYDEETTEQAKSEKFRRVVNLAKQLPSLIEDLQVALAKGDTPREKVVAAIVALIDRCQFRIGTDEYAEKHGTFGVTTLRPEHVTVSGSEVRFKFTGKKQVPWDKAVTDPDLAEFIEHLSADSPGDRLFWYYKDGKQYPVKASHVNAFLSEYGVTAKDLRTYHATKAMFEELKAASRPEKSEPLTKKETAARLKAAFEKVAYQMGHTPAVCRTSYVLPQLVDDFVQNGGRLSLSAWEGAVR